MEKEMILETENNTTEETGAGAEGLTEKKAGSEYLSAAHLEKERIPGAVEAILFAMGGSVEADRMAQAVNVTVPELHEIIAELNRGYEEAHRGMRILKLEDKYQMCSAKEYYDTLIRITAIPKKVHLTEVLMETLSIIAYKQPVTKIEIEKIRGVKSDHAVNKLVEYDLVMELGRMDAPGRPILFGTTEEFLRHFGVSSLEELPVVDPLRKEDFMEEAQQEIDMKLKV